MTTMGRLAIDLSESVKESTDLKPSVLFCSKYSYMCKQTTMRIIYAVFMTTGLILALVFSLEFSTQKFSFDWNSKHFLYSTRVFFVSLNTSFSCLILLFTLYYYFCMKMSLDGCTAPKKKSERIKKAFTVFYALLTCSNAINIIVGLFPYPSVIKNINDRTTALFTGQIMC